MRDAIRFTWDLIILIAEIEFAIALSVLAPIGAYAMWKDIKRT